MIKIYPLLLLSLISISGFSQGGFTLGFGANMPTGDYGGSESIEDGFVDRGSCFDLTAYGKIYKNFGVTLSYTAYGNPINLEKMEEFYGAPVVSSNRMNGVPNSRWSSNGFYIGLYYSQPLDKREFFRLIFELRTGFIFVQRPEIFLYTNDYSVSYRVKPGDDDATGWLFKASFGFFPEYPMVSFGLFYFSSKQEVLISNFSNSPGRGSVRFDQKVQAFGFSLNFGVMDKVLKEEKEGEKKGVLY